MDTPPMEPVMFNQAVEGLVRALGDKLSLETKAELKRRGVDVDHLAAAYAFETWLEVSRYAATLVAPGKPPGEQMHELGRRFIDGYEQTMVGKATLALLRILGPRRTLERMTRNFRTANNFAETKLEALGERAWVLWVNRVVFPEFYRGMLAAGLQRTGAAEVAVTVLSTDDGSAKFRVSWA